MSLYRILGLPEGFEWDDATVRRHYRKLMVQIHPDRCSQEFALKASQFVIRVFTLLSDPMRRAKYERDGLHAALGEDVDYYFISQVISFVEGYAVRSSFPETPETSFQMPPPQDNTPPPSAQPEDADDEPIIIDDDASSADPTEAPRDPPTSDIPSAGPTSDTSVPTEEDPPAPGTDMPPSGPSSTTGCPPGPDPTAAPSPQPSSPPPFGPTIGAVVDFTTRRSQLKFKVVWLPHRVESWEKYELVAREKYILAEYLDELRHSHPRKFANLYKKHPQIMTVFD